MVLQGVLNKEWFSIVICLLYIETGSSIRLGLFTGDIKRHAAPIILRRYSHHAPVFIHITPARLPPPRLPAKPHPLLIPPKLHPFILPPKQPAFPHALAKQMPVLRTVPLCLKNVAFPWKKMPTNPFLSPMPFLVPAKAAKAEAFLDVKSRLAVLGKLSHLQKSGSLTPAQFVRFRKLLLL